ncbi:4-coumarate--CoA ligase [Trifolium repens]|nr:4-coumarate--CoA ligase [Trifolium repens]
MNLFKLSLAVPRMKKLGRFQWHLWLRRLELYFLQRTLLHDYVAKQVVPHKKVRKVVFTDKIPRSAT